MQGVISKLVTCMSHESDTPHKTVVCSVLLRKCGSFMLKCVFHDLAFLSPVNARLEHGKMITERILHLKKIKTKGMLFSILSLYTQKTIDKLRCIASRK